MPLTVNNLAATEGVGKAGVAGMLAGGGGGGKADAAGMAAGGDVNTAANVGAVAMTGLAFGSGGLRRSIE